MSYADLLEMSQEEGMTMRWRNGLRIVLRAKLVRRGGCPAAGHDDKRKARLQG
jgi:hypothetical protein